jgi:hypothetical protein
MSWPLTFADPIPLSDGGELRTLRDAGNFIAKLPKREHDAAHRGDDAGRRTQRRSGPQHLHWHQGVLNDL